MVMPLKGEVLSLREALLMKRSTVKEEKALVKQGNATDN
jgi:hypothetical protein